MRRTFLTIADLWQHFPKSDMRTTINQTVGDDPSSPVSVQDSSGVNDRSSVDSDHGEPHSTPPSSQGGIELLDLTEEMDLYTSNDRIVVPEDGNGDADTLSRLPQPGRAELNEDNHEATVQPRRLKRQMSDDVGSMLDWLADEVDEHRSVIKRQRQDSLGATFPHDCMPGFPCKDPVAGVVLADTTPLVYSQMRFLPKQATDEEVQYILSRSDCTSTEYFKDLWETVLRVKEERQDQQPWPSKERYISARRYQELNELVQKFCPWPIRDETVDLTDDD